MAAFKSSRVGSCICETLGDPVKIELDRTPSTGAGFIDTGMAWFCAPELAMEPVIWTSVYGVLSVSIDRAGLLTVRCVRSPLKRSQRIICPGRQKRIYLALAFALMTSCNARKRALLCSRLAWSFR